MSSMGPLAFRVKIGIDRNIWEELVLCDMVQGEEYKVDDLFDDNARGQLCFALGELVSMGRVTQYQRRGTQLYSLN